MVRICFHLVAPARRCIEDFDWRCSKRAVIQEVNPRLEPKLPPQSASEVRHRPSLAAATLGNPRNPRFSNALQRFQGLVSLTRCCSAHYNLWLHRTRGGAVWQLVGLITRRSEVQILSPQPSFFKNSQPISVGARCKGAAIRFACARYEA